MEKFYLFILDDAQYEMTCGVSFKEAIWKMMKHTGDTSEMVCKCLKGYESDDVKGLIELFNHFSYHFIRSAYVVEKEIYSGDKS